MILLNLNTIVIFLSFYQVAYCQRRIVNGEEIQEKTYKKYVVYLVKARISPTDYYGWICGGALVSSEYIITSAACVRDVVHLYAIAGYNKYVNSEDIYTDKCTSQFKKKIVFTCVPKSYDLDYEKLEKWSYIDIAVVKVESPYNFQDKNYLKFCSYIPEPIDVNFEDKYQEPGTDAMVMGWGHQLNWRTPGDYNDYNQDVLNYAAVLIADKNTCKTEYQKYNQNMSRVIDKYMICSKGPGNINSEGKIISKKPRTAEGCETPIDALVIDEKLDCEEAVNTGDLVLVESNRKKYDTQNENNNTMVAVNHTIVTGNVTIVTNNDTIVTGNDTIVSGNNKTNLEENNRTSLLNKIKRRIFHQRESDPGICQNDHGGPLVTWVGSREVLIGVAAVFKVNKHLECNGPYLYTSTQCNGAFLDCLLTSDSQIDTPERRLLCENTLKNDSIVKVENHISWMDHPDGPSDNERNMVRPQHIQQPI